MIELYQDVLLKQDFPQYNLKKGDIATLIDIVPHPSGEEDGYILEFFDDIEGSSETVIVPFSAVESLTKAESLKC
ncbi:MAG: DUF4926 domain-containing protein [Snowella sp.]|nr:DUF4926 domain-containing protein [Snowella sp.]